MSNALKRYVPSANSPRNSPTATAAGGTASSSGDTTSSLGSTTRPSNVFKDALRDILATRVDNDAYGDVEDKEYTETASFNVSTTWMEDSSNAPNIKFTVAKRKGDDKGTLFLFMKGGDKDGVSAGPLGSRKYIVSAGMTKSQCTAEATSMLEGVPEPQDLDTDSWGKSYIRWSGSTSSNSDDMSFSFGNSRLIVSVCYSLQWQRLATRIS